MAVVVACFCWPVSHMLGCQFTYCHGQHWCGCEGFAANAGIVVNINANNNQHKERTKTILTVQV